LIHYGDFASASPCPSLYGTPNSARATRSSESCFVIACLKASLLSDGGRAPSTATVSNDVATIIDRSGIAVRAGTHCVMPLLSRFGVSATCRASFGLYNTREEVDGLAQALIKAQGFFA
jgi:hypothetical protein